MLNNNIHVRDIRIQFDEPTHIYTIDDSSINVISVTTFLHLFFEKFDSDKVIDQMMSNKEKFDHGPYKSMTKIEIQDKWLKDGQHASKLGTEMHKNIENFYQQGLIIKDNKEFDYFLNFHQDEIIAKGLIPYRSEWSIFIENIKLAGQLDMLYKHPYNNTYILYDWKRSKNIVYKNYCKKNCLYPLEHLSDCNYTHYSLQLNLYKYILETYYDLMISEMYLIILHPNQENYEKISVPILQDEIKSILDIKKMNLN